MAVDRVEEAEYDEPVILAGRATPWERLFLAVAVLLVTAFFVALFAYVEQGGWS